jgi:4-carboxymuconolactone decarboxylase
MAETPTFGRYAEIPYEQLTPEQQEGYRSLIETRGRLPGPNKISVHNPKLAKVMGPLGAHFRTGYSLSERKREIAVCIITSKFHAAYPTNAHERAAKATELPPHTVEAILSGLRPRSPTHASRSSTRWRRASPMRAGCRKGFMTVRSKPSATSVSRT